MLEMQDNVMDRNARVTRQSMFEMKLMVSYCLAYQPAAYSIHHRRPAQEAFHGGREQRRRCSVISVPCHAVFIPPKSICRGKASRASSATTFNNGISTAARMRTAKYRLRCLTSEMFVRCGSACQLATQMCVEEAISRNQLYFYILMSMHWFVYV